MCRAIRGKLIVGLDCVSSGIIKLIYLILFSLILTSNRLLVPCFDILAIIATVSTHFNPLVAKTGGSFIVLFGPMQNNSTHAFQPSCSEFCEKIPAECRLNNTTCARC